MNKSLTFIRPEHLKRGDTVGIVTVSAPEAAENPDRVERGVKRLRDMGFTVEFGKHALSNNKTYLAASPDVLAADINEMFRNEKIPGIICTGGGTNANRLLPYIDYASVRDHPKVFVGLSNPSVVLTAITAKTGLITFHGPVLVWNWGADEIPPYSLRSFESTLMRAGEGYEVPRSGEWAFLRGGQAQGPLIGGNLWSLESLLGTEYEPNWDGAIFFWEDIAKEPKRIDAALTHFKLAGVFDRIKGMIVGELVECEAKGPSLTIQDILLDLAADRGFPILSGVRLGHTNEKLTLPIGGIASIDSRSQTFRIEQSPVV